ncbi:WxL domain-containing protein [Candidatus Enterococcus ikei]|uniref:WxL domain-containing protein n=1 Tax=Candidatus Enterococcus ikei TaxID=2815326 RepID=A0ABS3H1Y7_9ENTE|nr:WxL domain-containing protein [Enterococcus sp. DIV0869a]MBO0441173.1 WxL domain-containing protein [Enterococcus sp. DIV0869a]
MKKRTLCTAALLAVLGTSALLPAGAYADDATNVTSKGKIEYVEDKGKNDDKHPEKPDVIVKPPYVPNEAEGALKIDGVSDLDFKQQNAVLTDADYFAEQTQVSYTKDDKTVIEKVGNYLQLTNKRIDNPTKWTLSAKMAQQFKGVTSENVLENSTITFTNPFIESETNKTVSPWPELTAVANGFVLGEDGASVDILESKDVKGGFGTYTVAFGNTKDYFDRTQNGTSEDSTGVANQDGKIENGSVSLMVPGRTVKTKEAYEAKILWTLTEKP